MSYIKLMRPKQWIKNFFVFAALIFSYSFLDITSSKKTFITFILFCLISSSVYIMNDIVDVEKDRKHPKKRFRPIASGDISKRNAIIFLFIITSICFAGAFIFNKQVLILLIIYFVNNILYSFLFKNIVLIDVFSIALGFILRVITGGVCIGVDLSPWIILCTLFVALFLGFEKRKNEIKSLKN